MNKARITYRFDKDHQLEKKEAARSGGKNGKIIPLSREEFEVLEEEHRITESTNDGTIQLNRFTTDFGSWKSPFDQETERIEKLIRESGDLLVEDSEHASRKPMTMSSPDEEQIRTDKVELQGEQESLNPETGFYDVTEAHGGANGQSSFAGPYLYDESLAASRLKRYSRPPWMKIILSVTGAVLTGVCFGFFVLNMFTGEPGNGSLIPLPGYGDPTNNRKAVESVPDKNSTDGTLPGTPVATPQSQPNATAAVKSGLSTVAVNIPGASYSFLQNGVFSTQQSADAALADLHKKGLAAASEAGDKYTVYVGAAVSRDDALALSRKLQQQSKPLDVYIKSYSLPAMSQVKWSGAKADGLAAYLTQGRQLIEQLDLQTTAHLGETKPTVPSDKEQQSIKSAHQSWTGAASNVAASAPEEVKSQLQTMSNAMNTAVVSLDEYKKSPSAAYLWQAQTSILQYIIAEKSLLTAITVN